MLSTFRSRATLAPPLPQYHALPAIQCRHASRAASAKTVLLKFKAKERQAARDRGEAPGGDKGSKKINRDESGANHMFKALSPNKLRESDVLQVNPVIDLKLPEFDPSQLVPEDAGKAFALAYPENAPCRKFGVPRNVLLDFRLLAKPATVVRDISMQMFDRLKEAANSNSLNNTYVLYGDTGSGKSYTLLQCVEWAWASDWLVLYVPRAISLVNSSTPYQYDIRTRTYSQPDFARSTLERFISVNHRLLEKMEFPWATGVAAGVAISPGSTFLDLCKKGLEQPHLAEPTLEVLMKELKYQNKYPVLLAVDDFQALFSMSAYRDPNFRSIRAWHLTFPRLLASFFGGRRTFRHGAVIGAVSTTNTTYRMTPELRYALGMQPELGVDPYTKIRDEIDLFTRAVEPIHVPHMNVNEAASLFEIWMRNKSLHTPANDDLFLSKYAESGGNPREFVWGGLLDTLQT